jgi:hypothetical protein
MTIGDFPQARNRDCAKELLTGFQLPPFPEAPESGSIDPATHEDCWLFWFLEVIIRFSTIPA